MSLSLGGSSVHFLYHLGSIKMTQINIATFIISQYSCSLSSAWFGIYSLQLWSWQTYHKAPASSYDINIWRAETRTFLVNLCIKYKVERCLKVCRSLLTSKFCKRHLGIFTQRRVVCQLPVNGPSHGRYVLHFCHEGILGPFLCTNRVYILFLENTDV